MAALLIAFLVDANSSALGAHPGRIVIAVLMILAAVLLMVSGVRRLRARHRSR
ncbi:MAG: hypothetical protein ACJ780_32340 [Solirubrobacteraceae bacterium]